MIEKILERLNKKETECVLKAKATNPVQFQKWMMKAYGFKESKAIVQEAAKEYDNGWIPVATELPKEHLWAGHMISEEVFVTFLDNNEKLRVDTDNTYDGKWHYYGDRVIAWMPKKLPTPYQKGEQYEHI